MATSGAHGVGDWSCGHLRDRRVDRCRTTKSPGSHVTRCASANRYAGANFCTASADLYSGANFCCGSADLATGGSFCRAKAEWIVSPVVGPGKSAQAEGHLQGMH